MEETLLDSLEQTALVAILHYNLAFGVARLGVLSILFSPLNGVAM